MPANAFCLCFVLFPAAQQLWHTARAHLHAGMSSRPRSNTTTPGRPVDRATDKNDSSTCICIKMMLCSNASSCDAISGARPAQCTNTTVRYNSQGIPVQCQFRQKQFITVLVPQPRCAHPGTGNHRLTLWSALRVQSRHRTLQPSDSCRGNPGRMFSPRMAPQSELQKTRAQVADHSLLQHVLCSSAHG